MLYLQKKGKMEILKKMLLTVVAYHKDLGPLPFFLIFLGAFMTVFGAAFLIAFFRRLREGKASLHWPTSPGEVIRTEVVKEALGRHRGGYTYFPKVEYNYTVDGISYHGTAISAFEQSDFEVGMASEKKALKAISPYQLNQTVPVYYNPQQPSQSLLMPGKLTGAGLPVSFGSMCLLLGPIAIVFGVKIYHPPDAYDFIWCIVLLMFSVLAIAILSVLVGIKLRQNRRG